jgi:hypothetical protein
MPIARTPWYDDDGSGLTGTIVNNYEKQLLYDQIDAFVEPVYGEFSLTDTSGAGLGVLCAASYLRQGPLLYLWANPVWPATTNGAAVKLGTLPFATSTVQGGFYVTYGPANLWLVGQFATEIRIYHPTSNALRTNAEMSGSNSVISGVLLLPR